MQRVYPSQVTYRFTRDFRNPKGDAITDVNSTIIPILLDNNYVTRVVTSAEELGTRSNKILRAIILVIRSTVDHL